MAAFPLHSQPELTSRARAAALRERRAKVVCTIGPSCSTESMIRELMRTGMDVARLNFSHGTHEEHARIIERLRRAAAKENRAICILQDLQGPKIRTGHLRDRRPVVLKPGSRVTITPRNVLGTSTLIPTSFKGLAQEVEPGGRVLLSDGLIELAVKAINGDDIECEVINGGRLGEHQGINLPGTALSVPSLTEKDRKDLEFGLKHDVDMVAISFVRTAGDVRETKPLIGVRRDDVQVIAKLEKPQAIEHLEEILEVADGVMVARGDLGVEMPPEQVPVMQKHIIRRAAEWRKPVITATQMLESMVENTRPTRAEASDVANAILDGSDALMLSAETASGKYPREAVGMMGRIIAEAEAHMREIAAPQRRREHRRLSIAETICESVAHAAEELDMKAVAVFTETGTTARLVSQYRPKACIFGFAHRDTVCNRMSLFWGVHPVRCEHVRTAEDMVREAESELVLKGAAARGDVVAVISGTHGTSGSTNLMRLHVIGQNDHPPERRRARAQAERAHEDHKR